MTTATCSHPGSVSKSRNVNRGGCWECLDCGEYLGGAVFGNEPFGPVRDVDTRDEAVRLVIA